MIFILKVTGVVFGLVVIGPLLLGAAIWFLSDPNNYK